MTNKKTFKIATWNVNSVNVRLNQIQKYCKTHSPDVLLLQELKCQNQAFPYEAIEEMGYQTAVHGQKSYNGVAILSKKSISDIKILDFTSNKMESRYIEGLINFNDKALRVASIYVPNGSPIGSERYEGKLQYYKRLREYLSSSLRDINYADFFIIGGDFNVAPQDIDVHSPTTMQNSIGFHVDEKKAFSELMDDGFVDVWRHINTNEQEFSWWDYRDRYSFANDRGMKIDHILTHKSFINKIASSGINAEYRTEIRPSDHAPVWCSIYV
jgi:exodeoxyribonuclease-3